MPMLARLVRKLPYDDDLLYEPKWDGFRCLVFRDGASVALQSRNERPLGRYFPELVEAFLAVATERFVADGEIVVAGPDGLDFTALLARLHPASSRVARLREETPAAFVAFDLVALGTVDLCGEPFVERRRFLEEVLAGAPPRLLLTPLTDDPRDAAAWMETETRGVEGVVVKHRDSRYVPGKRVMVKVKRERTADCVVAGFRWHGEQEAVGSLLLGLYDGELRHVGIIPSFAERRRRELLEQVAPYVTGVEGHPWAHGFGLDVSPLGRLPGAVSRWQPGHPLSWVPLRPELVCEVTYDHWEGDRFRHAPRFRHWRPDRDPRSCSLDQFPAPVGVTLDDLHEKASG